MDKCSPRRRDSLRNEKSLIRALVTLHLKFGHSLWRPASENFAFLGVSSSHGRQGVQRRPMETPIRKEELGGEVTPPRPKFWNSLRPPALEHLAILGVLFPGAVKVYEFSDQRNAKPKGRGEDRSCDRVLVDTEV